MKILATVLAVLLVTAAGLISAAHADNNEKWFLMSRHGKCAEIKILQRKVPDLGDINDPFSFIALMKKKGHSLVSNKLQGTQGDALEVNVPGEGLNLIFLKEPMCRSYIDPKPQK